MPRAISILGYVGYACLVFGVTVLAYYRPVSHSDMPIYAAAVLSLDESNADRIHSQVFGALEKESGRDAVYSCPSAFWKGISERPDYLMQQIQFYTAKPLYILLAHSLWRFGTPLLSSLHLISALSTLVIGSVLILWLRRPLFAGLLLLLPPVIEAVRLPTPDALSNSVIFVSIFALVRRKFFAAFLLLLLSIYIRVDNVIVVALLVSFAGYRRAVPLRTTVILLLVAGASVLWINHISGVDWQALMYRSNNPTPNPDEMVVHLGIRDILYFEGLGLRSLFSSTASAVLLVFALLGLTRLPRGSIGCQLLVLTLFAVLFHQFMFPFPQDRFNVWAYLLTGTFVVLAIADSNSSNFEGIAVSTV